jgi:hypothetical protein
LLKLPDDIKRYDLRPSASSNSSKRIMRPLAAC